MRKSFSEAFHNSLTEYVEINSSNKKKIHSEAEELKFFHWIC